MKREMKHLDCDCNFTEQEEFVEELFMNLKECDKFFMFFTRVDPNTGEDMQQKKIVSMEDEDIFNMIHHLFAENPKFFDDFLSYSENLMEDDSIPEENCGPLTEEEIEQMYNDSIERENNGTSISK